MVFQFQLSESNQEFQKILCDLVESLKDKSEDDILKALASEGYLSIPGSESAKAKDYISLTLAVEEISKAQPKVANKMVELLFAQETIKMYLESDCKEDCLSKVRTYEKKINVLVSEPGNYGVKDLATTIEKTDNGYKVTGTKIYAPENKIAEVFLIAGKLVDGDNSKLALVAVSSDKVSIENKEFNFASQSVTVEVLNIDCEVESDKVFSDIKGDLRVPLSVWRNLIAASAIGIAHSNLITSLAVSKGVKNSSRQAMSAMQGVQFTLSDMYAEIEGARMITYYSSALADSDKPNVRFSSMAKLQATEAAVVSSNSAATVLGNLGNVYNANYLEALQLAYNRNIKDGTPRNLHNVIYEEALAKR